jgi:hypothetical protein
VFGKVWGQTKWIAGRPIRAFPRNEIVENGRLIGTLVEKVRRRPRQGGPFRVDISVFSLFDGLAIRLFDGFELLGCCVTRYVGGETGLCKTVMWDMRDTARRWSKFAET